MTDAIKLTTVQAIIFDRLAAGALLHRQMREDGGSGCIYWLQPGGRSCPPSIAEALIGHGLVVSRGDDLFFDGHTGGGGQTFRLASPLPVVTRPKRRRRK